MDSTVSLPPSPALIDPRSVRDRLALFTRRRHIVELSRRSGVKAMALYHIRDGGAIDLEVLHRFWPVMDVMDGMAEALDRVAPRAHAAFSEPPATGRNPPSLP